MKKNIGFVLSLLVMLALACNLSGTPASPASPAPANPPQDNENQPGNVPQDNGEEPGNASTPEKAGTPPANPINMNEGLSSLNSYKMNIIYKSTGPNPKDSSTATIEMQRSQDQDARYTHYTTTTTKAGSDPSNGESSIYQIGNDQCNGSSGDWTWATLDPNQTEMSELVQNMFSLTPLIDNPSFVAAETVNDIPSNHFTFKVSGLGAKSGAAVNVNQGDYWLAVDGQYLVRYALTVETSMGPSVDVIHEEISMELSQVNKPVDIAFPKTCIAASKVTPTP